MSDEALNNHLDWLDKCAGEQEEAMKPSDCKHVYRWNIVNNDAWFYCELCEDPAGAVELETAINEHAALKQEANDVYCPVCGSCGEIGCCGVRCLYVKSQQGDYDELVKENAQLESEIKALKQENEAGRQFAVWFSAIWEDEDYRKDGGGRTNAELLDYIMAVFPDALLTGGDE